MTTTFGRTTEHRKKTVKVTTSHGSPYWRDLTAKNPSITLASSCVSQPVDSPKSQLCSLHKIQPVLTIEQVMLALENYSAPATKYLISKSACLLIKFKVT